MSKINPAIKNQFETLSPALQQEILKADIEINTLKDLIGALEEIIAQAD